MKSRSFAIVWKSQRDKHRKNCLIILHLTVEHGVIEDIQCGSSLSREKGRIMAEIELLPVVTLNLQMRSRCFVMRRVKWVALIEDIMHLLFTVKHPILYFLQRLLIWNQKRVNRVGGNVCTMFLYYCIYILIYKIKMEPGQTERNVWGTNFSKGKWDGNQL